MTTLRRRSATPRELLRAFPKDRLYLTPHAPAQAGVGDALLAGGPLGFGTCEIALRQGETVHRARGSIAELRDAAASVGPEVASWLDGMLARLGAPRAPFAGLDLDQPLLMGILNVTPDSFSDGGHFARADDAVAHGLHLADSGATIIDIGGESTRPGAEPVSESQQLDRILPVIEGLAGCGAVLSVDTRKAAVMHAALAAGADMVNDISALRGDPASLATVAKSGAPVLLMHMQGEPATMQADPSYGDVALDVFDGLEERIGAAMDAGIARERIAIDPGLGFGKTRAHNWQLLNRLALFHGLGCAVALGASRKSFLGGDAASRLAGSLAAALAAAARGAHIIRVHDVAETAQALAAWRAAATGRAPG